MPLIERLHLIMRSMSGHADERSFGGMLTLGSGETAE
jgi:hypothetical protein